MITQYTSTRSGVPIYDISDCHTIEKFEMACGVLKTLHLQPIAKKPACLILTLYGGTIRPDYRHTVASGLGEHLAHDGFSVITFDYRTNQSGQRFEAYGMRDRLEDAQAVLDWLPTYYPGLPIIVWGASMGGYFALELAAAAGNENVKAVVAVAPAAYEAEAMKPGIRFGSMTQEILRRSRPLTCPLLHDSAGKIRVPVLIIGYEEDEVVRSIPKAYHVALQQHLGEDASFESLPGSHRGTFANGERTKAVAKLTANFAVRYGLLPRGGLCPW